MNILNKSELKNVSGGSWAQDMIDNEPDRSNGDWNGGQHGDYGSYYSGRYSGSGTRIDSASRIPRDEPLEQHP